MDIILATALIGALAAKAREAPGEQEARMVIKEIWDIAGRCLQLED